MTCESDESPTSIALGIGLAVGTVISYLPQTIAVWRRKSAEGLSYYWLFLAVMSCWFTLLNAIPEQWANFHCCTEVSFGECQAKLLLFYQLIAACCGSTPILISFLIFYRDSAHKKVSDESEPLMAGAVPGELEEQRPTLCKRVWFQSNLPKRNLYFKLTGLEVVILLATSLALVGLMVRLGPNNEATKHYADVLGYLSGAIVIVQFSPQIVTTCRNQSAGSLSLLMLCIQAPGSFLVVYYQAVVQQVRFSTWVPFLLAGLQQTLLIVLCVGFHLKEKALRKRQLN